MHSARENDAVSESDCGGRLGFEMQIGIEKSVMADKDVGGASDEDWAFNDDRRGKWLAQLRGQGCVRM